MVCDVCNATVTPDSSYFLTTAQVVKERRYWEESLSTLAGLYRMVNPTGVIDPATVRDQVQQAAGQRTAWAVCESCAGFFEFDREAARGYAVGQQQPPGCGPVNPREVEHVALDVWRTSFAKRPAGAGRPQQLASGRPREGWFSRLRSRLRGG